MVCCWRGTGRNTGVGQAGEGGLLGTSCLGKASLTSMPSYNGPANYLIFVCIYKMGLQ